MSLVRIEDFKGSVIASEAINNMLECGLILYCKSFGYTVNIQPNFDKYPDGLIDDSPNSHRICLGRYVNVTNSKKNEHDILADNSKDNIKINRIFGYEFNTQSNITVDFKTHTRWYNHIIEITVNRDKNESDEDYALRLTEILYKTVNR